LIFFQEEFEAMTLKQKESFVERKHQELDVREEKSIKELDQLTQSERAFCRLLTAVELQLIPGTSLFPDEHLQALHPSIRLLFR
jgi:hypothetical protein